jgi:hypothetical protein
MNEAIERDSKEKNPTKKRIEIIAVGEDRIYSVCAVEISPDGDVYVIDRDKHRDFHMSRHASGQRHWKVEGKLVAKFDNGSPTESFRGFEFLMTIGFGFEALPRLYEEYKMEKCDGVFAIDMREYRNSPFNLGVSIFTEEGLPLLLKSSNDVMQRRQIYIFPDIHPMIALTVGETKK